MGSAERPSSVVRSRRTFLRRALGQLAAGKRPADVAKPDRLALLALEQRDPQPASPVRRGSRPGDPPDPFGLGLPIHPPWNHTQERADGLWFVDTHAQPRSGDVTCKGRAEALIRADSRKPAVLHGLDAVLTVFHTIGRLLCLEERDLDLPGRHGALLAGQRRPRSLRCGRWPRREPGAGCPRSR